MSNEIHKSNSHARGDYERRDIGVSGVLYFLGGLVIAGFLVYFVVNGIFWYLSRRFEAEQTPVSPLVTNAPVDTRRIPPQYRGDYKKYLKEGFPAPQLEVDERTQLDEILLREDDTLSSYGWIDRKAGVVRIPIDRAMDLIAQRGLPVRSESGVGEDSSTQTAKAEPRLAKKKGSKQ